MELVNCDPKYWEFVRYIRTHKDNTNCFYTQPNITTEEQIRYMENNSERYKICLINEIPVGYVGIINDNEITYCVDPNYKGKGIGTFMVSEIMKLNDELIAFVIPSNIASNKVFEKLGFNKQIFFKYKK